MRMNVWQRIKNNGEENEYVWFGGGGCLFLTLGHSHFGGESAFIFDVHCGSVLAAPIFVPFQLFN